jgi:integrase
MQESYAPGARRAEQKQLSCKLSDAAQATAKGDVAPNAVADYTRSVASQNSKWPDNAITPSTFVPCSQVTVVPAVRPFLNVHEAADLLGTSQSWIRRHVAELPAVRVGRLVRFDAGLLLRRFQCKNEPGNRLKPKGTKNMNLRLRRYQKGSIYKCGKRVKNWYGMWREDVKQPDGSIVRRQHNVKLGTLSELPTRAAAQEALARRISALGPTTTEMKFSELVERWRATIVPTIKTTTATYYQNILRAHIVPAFGEKQVSAITRCDVEWFLAERAHMYCRNTLRGMRVSLGRVLSWAVQCEWLAKNPCSGVKLPHAGHRIERTILTAAQVSEIAKKLDEPYATLVLFLAITGLRIGEAVGIKPSDFEGDVLHVRRRIYAGKADTMKTQKSARDLPIPEALCARLFAVKGREWIFESGNGTPVNPGNALKRYIHPAVRSLGINIGGWHDFRHTLATRSLKKWPAKVVSEILGHAHIQTTLNVYQHVGTEDFRAPLIEFADELLRDVTKLPSADPSGD